MQTNCTAQQDNVIKIYKTIDEIPVTDAGSAYISQNGNKTEGPMWQLGTLQTLLTS